MGWIVAHLGPTDRATRAWCVLASVTADLDGLGVLFGPEAYLRYHRVFGHTLLFGAGVTLLSARWVGLRPRALGLVFLAFLSHLVGDYFGGGPGWPLWPFQPFADTRLLCPCQWDLVSWQNTLITVVAIGATLAIGVRHGRTPLEFVHAGLERIVVDTLRLRWRAAPCTWCPAWASLTCHACGRPTCERDVASWRRLRVRCRACRGQVAGG